MAWKSAVAPGLDLGLQPVSNRFKRDLSEGDFRYQLRIAQCANCGLVQLAEPFPCEELRPHFEWIRYREREDHLQEAISIFLPLLEKLEPKSACGITDFDAVLFHALPKSLSLTYAQLSPYGDLAISGRMFGMETFQRALTPARATSLPRAMADAVLVDFTLSLGSMLPIRPAF